MVLKSRPMVLSSVLKFVVISAVVEASCAVTEAVSMLAVAVTELARASCEARAHPSRGGAATEAAMMAIPMQCGERHPGSGRRITIFRMICVLLLSG